MLPQQCLGTGGAPLHFLWIKVLALSILVWA